MNRAELRRAVRRYLQEAGSAKYDDTLLNTELDRSARSLAGQLGLVQSDVEAVTDDAGRAVVPGLVNVVRVLTLNGRPHPVSLIGYSDVYDRDARGWSATGAPQALVVDEGGLGRGVVALWPNPGAGTSVRVLAFTDGGPLSTDDTPAWGGRYETHHDVIAYHAAHALMASNGTRAASDPAWWQRYQLRLEELRDLGSAGTLTRTTRMGSAMPRRNTRW